MGSVLESAGKVTSMMCERAEKSMADEATQTEAEAEVTMTDIASQTPMEFNVFRAPRGQSPVSPTRFVHWFDGY